EPEATADRIYLPVAAVTGGYLSRSGFTSMKLRPTPFSLYAGPVYRPAHLTRNQTDGVFEYIGRIDHQLKIRGFRIELGEIEARLVQQAAVREAFVLAHDSENGQQLVAYIVPCVAALPVAGERQAAMRESYKSAPKDNLPDYRVPAFLLFLDATPL
ncbi:hypothetical protein C3L29_038180, partial [Pseudomonas sp. MWU12-2534b]